ncbi:hypothetical protein FQN54_009757 [Arachnomyces sp. PD_36]|nr:hypothetical protein FQN54_009757 [Arachnomyces sp. PD_36]
MPLPSDEKTVETSRELAGLLRGIFGAPCTYRPVHAKGILIQGTFKPTAEASSLSAAPHFNQESTPVIARLSVSSGDPELPDTDPSGNPRGFGLRFMLEESPRRVHTDIVAHSTPFFPAKDGPSALDFFRSLKAGTIDDYIATHPAAKAFLGDLKRFPHNFTTDKYFGVNAFKFVSSEGKETFIKYRIVPTTAEAYLDDEQVKTKGPRYLFDALPDLIAQDALNFDLVAQVANEGDVTDDCTVIWPEDRRLVKLGSINLKTIMENNDSEQKRLIFDAVPRVNGIEPSADPLIDIRAGVYLIGGMERRAA